MPVSRLFGSPPMVPSRRHRLKKLYAARKEEPSQNCFMTDIVLLRYFYDFSDSIAALMKPEYDDDLKYLLTPKKRPVFPAAATTHRKNMKVRI